MNCIGLLALSLSLVSARDVFRAPDDVSSPSYVPQQQQEEVPLYDPFNFDSSDASSMKSVMHPPMIPHFPFGPFRNHGNQPSVFDAMHHHMKEMHRQVPLVPFFSKGFDEVPFLPSAGDESHPSPAGPHDQGFGGFFKKFFEGSFRDAMTPAINPTSFDHLPPNYQNSTSQTHHIDGSKVVVNETTHKKSGDNFHQVYHFKVVQVSPHDQPEVQLDDEYENEADTWEVQPEAESRPLPTEGRDDSLNDVIPSSADSYSVTNSDSYDSNGLKNQVRRSIDVYGPPVEKEIQFPPEELNRFPHSMANNHLVTGGKQEDGKVSRSYVYRDQGGNSFLYSVDHKDLDGKKDFEKKDEPVYRDNDVERVGPIPPPDLSRDTRVNPDGRSTRQQGITLVDPDAEVFDLSLVIKEMESRADE